MYTLGRESWFKPNYPHNFSKRFRRTLATFEECPSREHHSRYITLFLKGNYSVVRFYELMRVSLAGLKHFLKERQGNLSVFHWSY